MKNKIISAGIVIFLVTLLLPGCGKKNANDLGIKEKATQTLQKIKGTTHQDNLLYLRNKLNTYKRQNGKYPDSLQQLVNEGIIDKIPEPPPGMQYQYDPSTGKLDLK